MSRPLRSTATPASSGFPATTSRSASERLNRYSMPPVSAVGTLPLAARRTDPQARDGRFQRSPSHVPCKSRRPGSRRLHAGHHLAKTAGTRQAHPGNAGAPRFRCHLTNFDASTTTPGPQQAKPDASGTPSWSPPDQVKPSLLPDRSPRRSSANAAPGDLTPTPAGPTPEGQQASPGSRRESHPPAPTDPHVSLSTHTARAVRLSGRSAAVSPMHEHLGVP